MTLEEFAAVIVAAGRAPASPDRIAAFERRIGTRLPDDYRRFLGLTGGGRVPGQSGVFRDEENDRCEHVRRIGGLGTGGDPEGEFDLLREFEQPSWYPLPADLLWIGADAGGNPLMLCLREDRLGEVFLIDHEVVSFEGEPDPIEAAEEAGLAFPLAPHFTAFVAGIRPE